MKKGFIKIFLGSIVVVGLLITGCGKTDGVLGPNMNGQVSFRISQQVTTTGSMQFLFTPNMDINISKIISRYDAQPFADTLLYYNTAYVYSKDTTYIINQYVGVHTGQQWNFDFTGAIPGQTQSNYNVTTNYTVQ